LGLDYAKSNLNVLMIVTGDHETGGMIVDLVSSGNMDEDGPFTMPNGTSFFVNWTTTGHTDVIVLTTAYGTYADNLTGTYENTHIFDVMRQFLGWEITLPLIKK
jgi:alkaline phosphatase